MNYHCCLFLFSLGILELTDCTTGSLPNVVLVLADDLRPTLGCYQALQRTETAGIRFSTPHLDRFSTRAALFTNVFAQEALCGPSRTSLLTGRRPTTLNIYTHHGQRYFRTSGANFTTLPQYFRSHGYHTVSAGKVFHPGKMSGGNDDFPYSWSQPPFHPSAQKYKQAKVCYRDNSTLDGKTNIVCPVTLQNQPEQTLPDIQTTDFAVDFLHNRSIGQQQQEPFFLAVGFHKPHIPLKYPSAYRDLYPLGNISLAENHLIPDGMPDIAWNPWQDMRLRDDVMALNASFPYGPLPSFYQKLVRQSYYSAVSFIDAQFGRIIDAIDASGFANDTIVVFTSDHGWSLGEHGEWSKYSNYGVATRVPLLVRLPNEDQQPQVLTDLIELIDLFPTFVDIVGLPPFAECPTAARQSRLMASCSDGRSFAPLIRNEAAVVNWRPPFVRFQFPRPSQLPQLNSDQPAFGDIRFMGYSIRCRRFRYTEWIPFRPRRNRAFVGLRRHESVVARELYLLRIDPSENRNLANDSRFSRLIRRLSRVLRKAFQ